MVGAQSRPASALAWLSLAVALAAQLAAHGLTPGPRAHPADLSPPPSEALARVMALGDAPALARALMLDLQTFDVQPGVSLPLRTLDYGQVIAWLRLIVRLHPDSQYALLSAARLYAEVPDPVRTRMMLEFIHAAFLEDPNRRWPWLAHAVILARHRLGDTQLALFYARELRIHVDRGSAPPWVGEMEALALADLGEREAARVLLGGLLASGTITEPHERHFLIERLEALDAEPAPPSAPRQLRRVPDSTPSENR